MRGTRFEKWRQAAHTKIGDQLFRVARADFEAGTTGKPQFGTQLAKVLSAIIILSPFALIGFGLAIMVFDFPNLFTLVIGAILVAAGAYAIPRRNRLGEGGYAREDLPELFKLTDEIGARLGAHPLDKIYLDEDVNAYYFEARDTRVMGFGFGLWEVISPEERIAVISHELSHQVNGDAARTGIISKGIYTLDRWYDLFSPSDLVDDEGYLLREREAEDLIAAGKTGTMRSMVELISITLSRLFYLDSQRAEYLADALSTRASGVRATQSMLSKLALLPLIDDEVRGLVPAYVKNGTAFYARLSNAVNQADEDTRSALFGKMQEELQSVDQTHPPTFRRIAFLTDIAEPTDAPVAYPGAVLDAELAPFIEKSGQKVLESLQFQ